MKAYRTISFILFLIPLISYSQSITSVEPDSANQCQKLNIYVTGEGLQFLQGTSTIWLENGSQSISPENSTVLNSNEIVGEFFFNPEHDTGVYNVNALDGGTPNWYTLTDGFTLKAVEDLPVLINSTPDSVSNGETVSFTIFGQFTHFDIQGVNNYVRFLSNTGGSIYADNISIVNAEKIVATFFIEYNKPSGYYDLHVTNNLDSHMILEDAMYIRESATNPEIVSVEPNTAYQGEQLNIVVTGRNTHFEQGSSVLKFIKTGVGTITPETKTVLNDTVIVGQFILNYNDVPGMYDVRVSNNYWGDVILSDGFELYEGAGQPELLWLEPTSAYMGTRVKILIKSENTHYNNSDNYPTVSLYYIYEELYPQSVTVIDSVTLEAEFVFSYENLTDPKKLIVNSPLDGTLHIDNAFQIIEREPNASISKVDPDSAYINDVMMVNITGHDIIFMPGTSQIILTQGNFSIAATNETIVNDTTITGEFNFLNSFPLGLYDVVVNNSWAWPELSLIDGFTLNLFDLIDENTGFSYFSVYPNPCNGILNIKRNIKGSESFYLELFDLKGNRLKEVAIPPMLNEYQIDVEGIKSGKYLIKISNNNKLEVKSIIIDYTY